jgi:hypothetical protein
MVCCIPWQYAVLLSKYLSPSTFTPQEALVLIMSVFGKSDDSVECGVSFTIQKAKASDMQLPSLIPSNT